MTHRTKARSHRRSAQHTSEARRIQPPDPGPGPLRSRPHFTFAEPLRAGRRRQAGQRRRRALALTRSARSELGARRAVRPALAMQRAASGPAIPLDFDPGQLLLDPDHVLEDDGGFERW